MLDVRGVAQELQLSERRVRQLLAQGVLRGRRLGGRWLVTDADLDAFRVQPRVEGRPWSSTAAWAVLAEFGGLTVRTSSVQRCRARQRLHREPLAQLTPRLRHRAELVRCYAHPAALRRIAQDDTLVLAGLSAAPHVHADLIAPADHLDAYIRDQDLDPLIRRYALEENAERPDLMLRVVSASLWPFADGTRIAPPVVVAVDLMESPDDRTRRAGRQLLTNP